jgi:uncharacterized membrane protein
MNGRITAHINKIREIAGLDVPAFGSREQTGKRVNLLLGGVVVASAIAPLFLTDPFVAFIFGVWVGAIVLGTLWLLRERERGRAFKAHQARIEILEERDRRQGMLIVYLQNELSSFNKILSGRVTLSVTAPQKAMSYEQAIGRADRNGGAAFSGRKQ